MKTQNKILASAWKTFLLYGYHSTTLEQIASGAGTSTTIIHYYFRTKEDLYREVVGILADALAHYTEFEYLDAHLTWFIVSELRNNKHLFLDALSKQEEMDWERKLLGRINLAMDAIPPAYFSEIRVRHF